MFGPHWYCCWHFIYFLMFWAYHQSNLLEILVLFVFLLDRAFLCSWIVEVFYLDSFWAVVIDCCMMLLVATCIFLWTSSLLLHFLSMLRYSHMVIDDWKSQAYVYGIHWLVLHNYLSFICSLRYCSCLLVLLSFWYVITKLWEGYTYFCPLWACGLVALLCWSCLFLEVKFGK